LSAFAGVERRTARESQVVERNHATRASAGHGWRRFARGAHPFSRRETALAATMMNKVFLKKQGLDVEKDAQLST
jgi:hypothetical protein